MKVITFFNNKGGVGKTTTIINLASYLSIYREKRVLVVDLDPQSNSTQAILPEETWLEFMIQIIIIQENNIRLFSRYGRRRCQF